MCGASVQCAVCSVRCYLLPCGCIHCASCAGREAWNLLASSKTWTVVVLSAVRVPQTVRPCWPEGPRDYFCLPILTS